VLVLIVIWSSCRTGARYSSGDDVPVTIIARSPAWRRSVHGESAHALGLCVLAIGIVVTTQSCRREPRTIRTKGRPTRSGVRAMDEVTAPVIGRTRSSWPCSADSFLGGITGQLYRRRADDRVTAPSARSAFSP
jgi:hypothetical protein